MASTYSTNLKIELQATGENSGTWGTITNTNLGTALEQAIVGYGNPNYASDANLTLTYTDTNAAQAARALVLNVTSGVSLTGTRELVVPTIQKQYIVQNNTTGAQSITVKTSAGTGITVPNGRKAHLYVNGTDVIYMDDYVDINGGAIDGTPIGANSASTGAFTTVTASGNITSGGILQALSTVQSSSGADLSLNANGANRDVFLKVNGTTLMTVQGSTGNVGIGTTSPATNLSVVGTGITDASSNGAYQVTVDNNAAYNLTPQGGIIHRFKWSSAGTLTTGAGIRFYKPNTNDSDASSQIGFLVRSGIAAQSQAMTLDSSGNLGIGTTSPASKLDVRNTGGTYDKGISIQTASAGNIGTIWTSLTDLNIGIAGAHKFTNFDGSATRMTLDSSGNLGLGVTPSGWASGWKVLEAQGGFLGGGATSYLELGQNNYYDGAFKYKTTAAASLYEQISGAHRWYNAPSGTAGNAITFTQAMTLDASGNLSVGTTSTSPGLGNTTTGIALLSSGIGAFSKGSQQPLYLNRNTDDGIVVDMRRDGTTFGVIGAASGGIYFGTGSSGTERGRFTADGNLLVGTTTNKTTIVTAGASGITIGAVSAPTLAIWDSTDAGYISYLSQINENTYLGNNANGFLSFGTNATERARITSDGNLLVGTTTNVSGLTGVISDVSGNVRAIPQSGSDKTTSYTLVKSDVGKFIGVGSGGSITVPDATFATGDVVSIFNNTTGNVTLTMTITTAYIGGTNTDKATITLATRGVATILFISGTVCVVNGNVS